MKSINEMTVGEVIELPIFMAKVEECLDEIIRFRGRLHEQASKVHAELKRSPMERLQEKGLFNAHSIKAIYRRILDKAEKELSSTERDFVRGIGDEAIHRVIRQAKIEEENQKIHSHEKEKTDA